MDCSGPYKYTLILSGSKENRVIGRKMQDGNVTSFKWPVTLNKTPKIYILKYKDAIVYVGYTSQSISVRLYNGLKAKGLNGYHGYKWKQHNEIELFVFVFEQDLKGSKHDNDKPFVAFVEAIEAELVYKVRCETGKWPAFQNEIHFNNYELEKAKEVADEIYNLINDTKKIHVSKPYKKV